MNRAEKWLALWLRLSAAVLLLAVVAVFLPFHWMSAVNDWLGLAPLTDTPLVNYLTRSLSAVYALLGVLTLALSLDVRRYRPLIGWVAWSYAGFGPFLIALDILVGMPTYWALIEGPAVLGTGLVQLVLLRCSRPVSESA
jgi:hypothetical protein